MLIASIVPCIVIQRIPQQEDNCGRVFQNRSLNEASQQISKTNICETINLARSREIAFWYIYNFTTKLREKKNLFVFSVLPNPRDVEMEKIVSLRLAFIYFALAVTEISFGYKQFLVVVLFPRNHPSSETTLRTNTHLSVKIDFRGMLKEN